MPQEEPEEEEGLWVLGVAGGLLSLIATGLLLGVLGMFGVLDSHPAPPHTYSMHAIARNEEQLAAGLMADRRLPKCVKIINPDGQPGEMINAHDVYVGQQPGPANVRYVSFVGSTASKR